MWVQNRMNELEEELERLREFQVIVDSVLRRASFTSASQIPADLAKPVQTTEKPAPIEGKEDHVEVRPLRRSKDGQLLGNAYISKSSLTITPDVQLTTETPPFKSFFVNRILEGMRSKDQEAAEKGVVQKDTVIKYEVEEEKGVLKKIQIWNYGDNTRMGEILNTATWAFTRMLEKRR